MLFVVTSGGGFFEALWPGKRCLDVCSTAIEGSCLGAELVLEMALYGLEILAYLRSVVIVNLLDPEVSHNSKLSVNSL
jgi:hypothetical protein